MQLFEKSSTLETFFRYGFINRKNHILPTAITYCLNHCKHFEDFLLDGRLETDNTRSERSIKPFVISKKIRYSQIHSEVLEEVPL
ncbi:IS66 family transposase [Bacillus thuringiensis]|uniref:IS66 family transposase n=1 Tax=Bacillus thuringiensis TaxID=1428 RepID=UPI003A8C652B